MSSRRTFLQQAGLATTGLMLRPKGLFASTPLIGLQLWTVRRELAKDPDGTLGKVAGIGYNSVELMGYANGKFFGLTPAQFSDVLKKYHLKSPSGHYGMSNFLLNGDMNDLHDNIAVAANMGHSYIVIPFLNDNMRTSLEDYKKLAQKFNVVATEAKKSGLKTAYHNHDFEFKDWGGGQTGYNILLKETDPSLVFFEMDIYWTVRAGQDPIQLINNNPGRFKMWHLKDMTQKAAPSYDVGGQQYYGEVGTGIIDFKAIFREKRKSGMKYFYVEQDETSEPVFDAITKSYNYVKANLA
ncbi:MAG TPA: sugar phosphate isomerase/epimerase [Puia sp.]|jgi:sugar phosphate isomerase/epimerase|nr:sugar phosphate isomerase/epimerase [Puia sp.]